MIALVYEYELVDECVVVARFKFKTKKEAQLFLLTMKIADENGHGIVVGFEKEEKIVDEKENND